MYLNRVNYPISLDLGSTLTRSYSGIFKHLLNSQNSFKFFQIWVYLDTSRVGAVLVDHPTFWCLWCPDSSQMAMPGWGPLDWRKMLSKALMQMWEPRCAHVSRSLAWGTLDQDNTSCLVQGIPALKRTLTWCHWDPWMQRSSKMHYFLCICLFDGNPYVWPL